MDLPTFDRLLLATLDDQALSRGERQALAAALADHALTEQQLAAFRHHVFDLARQRLGGAGREQIVDWVEAVMKLLLPRESPPAGAEAARAWFSPGDNCTGVILDLLNQPRKTIDICVFTITDDQIAAAIRKAHRGGTVVRIITDNDKSADAGSDIEWLIKDGIPVRIDRTEYHMHHKFALFDRAVLATGSFNWTRNAGLYNHENIVVTNDAGLVRQFAATFEELWRKFAP